MREASIDLGAGQHESVWVAERFWERLRGLMARPLDVGLLLPGCSVHSVGMRRGLTVVALDSEFQVVATRRLRPGGVWAVRGARWMLELPTSTEPPPIGSALRLLPAD